MLNCPFLIWTAADLCPQKQMAAVESGEPVKLPVKIKWTSGLNAGGERSAHHDTSSSQKKSAKLEQNRAIK